jgi:hypothetical protein
MAMTDKEVQTLVRLCWNAGVNAISAAEIIRNKGIKAEQFDRATRDLPDILICEKYGIKGDYE